MSETTKKQTVTNIRADLVPQIEAHKVKLESAIYSATGTRINMPFSQVCDALIRKALEADK